MPHGPNVYTKRQSLSNTRLLPLGDEPPVLVADRATEHESERPQCQGVGQVSGRWIRGPSGDSGGSSVRSVPVAPSASGLALEGRRQEVTVATKCGLAWTERGRLFGRLRAQSVRQEIEEAWTVIAEAIQAGKIRYGGVSNFSVAQIRRAQAIHPVASLQPPYSMLVRDVERELLPFCAANRIGVIAYSPLQVGLLTGKVTREWVAELPANLRFVEGLRALAARHGRSIAELAIAWVLRRPEVVAEVEGLLAARKAP